MLEDPSRKYCDTCFPDRRDAIVAKFAIAGPAALTERRAEGTDPAHSAEARRKQGMRAAENVLAVAEWNKLNQGQLMHLDFSRDILPGLRLLPLSSTMRATGLSLRYSSLIRRGLKVPHARH